MLSGRVAVLYQCEQGSGRAHMVARYAVFVLPVVYAYLPPSAVRCFVTCLAALSLYCWLSEIASAPVLESCCTVSGDVVRVQILCADHTLLYLYEYDKSSWYPFVPCGCYSNPCADHTLLYLYEYDKSSWYPFVPCGCYSNPYRTVACIRPGRA